MKKLFVFDLDNTLRSTNLKQILPNTRKLLYEIAGNPDYVLALATGRGLSKLDVLGDLSALFKYKILVNGALTIEDGVVINEYHIDQKLVQQIIGMATKRHIAVGLVGLNEEVVTRIDENVERAFDNFQDIKPNENPLFYLNHPVYQMWIFHKNERILEEELRQYQDLEIYHWHDGGFDIVTKGISKASALKTLKTKYPNHQVIAVGDGHNDLDMIGLADIGIILENSKWIIEAEGLYQYIAPHVDKDLLHEFLKNNKII